MRDGDTIDAELRLLARGAAVHPRTRRRAVEPQGDEPPTNAYATARWTADRSGQSRTRYWRRRVEHNTCSVGIVAFRMPMRERTYVCEHFLHYLPG